MKEGTDKQIAIAGFEDKKHVRLNMQLPKLVLFTCRL